MFDVSVPGLRIGKDVSEYADVLQPYLDGKITKQEAAAAAGVSETYVQALATKLRQHNQAIKEAEARAKDAPVIQTPFLVFVGGEWRAAEADGKGGFRGCGWAVMNGSLYHAKKITRPAKPSNKPKCAK